MQHINDATNNLLNALLADAEWQRGLTDSQRRIAINFAHSWILDAVQDAGANVEREYIRAREGLRRIANYGASVD